MSDYLLEICAYNYSSAIIAKKAGAHRIELCDNMGEGGTTPSYGSLKMVRENVDILLYPIIRPRGGHAFYTEEEFEVMKQDIRLCKELGVDGIVTGFVKTDGRVDAARLKDVIELAYPMGVTFHRAFDATPDPFEAMETIIEAGCERILTSGQKPAAIEGIDMIAELVKAANERIIIMPGAGVRASNLKALKTGTGSREFHSSAHKIVEINLSHTNEYIQNMGHSYIADEENIKEMIKILKDHE